MTERPTLDPELAALCDAAACWLADIGSRAAAVALTPAQWISLVTIPTACAGVSDDTWVEIVTAQARTFGLTLAQGLAAQLRAQHEAAKRLAAAPNVLHTGYAPEPISHLIVGSTGSRAPPGSNRPSVIAARGSTGRALSRPGHRRA